MTGMHASTGKPLAGEAHIAQSIRTILSTPLGSRCMRRDFGSRLPELVDAPQNAATRLLLCAATAGALARWEPRIRLSRVRVLSASAEGRLTLELTARRTDLPSPSPLTLSIAL